MFVKRDTNRSGTQTHTARPVYLDCAATTPIDPAVAETVTLYLSEEFGNAGSRTHEFGAKASQAVQLAREQVAGVLLARRDEIVFTSGATEANNLAILGLAPAGERTGRKHIVSTAVEHKAVLEPLEALCRRGFDVSFVAPRPDGQVNSAAVLDAVRSDTLLVSVMHVNNETGVIQPIGDIAKGLSDPEVFLHTDAAQGFGKDLAQLREDRVDLISVSGHKLFAPKGVGCLVMRTRDGERPPIAPLMFGGGQERGLRPGTLPVHLIAGFGHAAELALTDHEARRVADLRFRSALLDSLRPLGIEVNSDLERTLPHVLSFSIPGVDSEAAMLVLKHHVSISNGSACTSASYAPSHVLRAMGLPEERIEGTLRWSWCYLTETPDWDGIKKTIAALR